MNVTAENEHGDISSPKDPEQTLSSAEPAAAGDSSEDTQAASAVVDEQPSAPPRAGASEELTTADSLDEGPEEPAGASQAEGAKRKMRWYVVQAYSGFEAKVKASLEQRVQENDLEDYFGEILIPRENVTETRGTARRVTSRTFYPGYIFVQMHLTDQTWHLVKDTSRVSGFVGGRHPTAVPNSQIAAVAQQVAEGAAKPKPRVVFEQGDHVRVIEGAFANFTGTIEEVKPEKQKVRVLVSIFGRATPVELDYGQVEKTV